MPQGFRCWQSKTCNLANWQADKLHACKLGCLQAHKLSSWQACILKACILLANSMLSRCSRLTYGEVLTLRTLKSQHVLRNYRGGKRAGTKKATKRGRFFEEPKLNAKIERNQTLAWRPEHLQPTSFGSNRSMAIIRAQRETCVLRKALCSSVC